MKYDRVIVALLLLMAALPAFGMHPSPGQLQPVTNNAVRYVVPNDKGLRAHVQAFDVQTGRKLWTKTIFRHWYIPPFGTECMHYEYLTSMSLQAAKLTVTSDRGRIYALDIHTRAVRRAKAQPNKPAAGNAGIASRLTIEHRWPGVPEPERWAG